MKWKVKWSDGFTQVTEFFDDFESANEVKRYLNGLKAVKAQNLKVVSVKKVKEVGKSER